MTVTFQMFATVALSPVTCIYCWRGLNQLLCNFNDAVLELTKTFWLWSGSEEKQGQAAKILILLWCFCCIAGNVESDGKLVYGVIKCSNKSDHYHIPIKLKPTWVTARWFQFFSSRPMHEHRQKKKEGACKQNEGMEENKNKWNTKERRH